MRSASVRAIAEKARQPKTRLIELHGELLRAGQDREARALGSIIGKLEAWENRA